MSYIQAKDISKWQGTWQDTGEPVVFIKMSGGDDGLYFDSQAASNYSGAKAAGKVVGGYHFSGWTNASAEAAFFLKGMSPVAENDLFALDIEAIPSGINPVAWANEFTQYIHDQIGVWCIVYMNLSTLNSYDWTSVLANSGLWLADWAVSPDANIPTNHGYIMQQYSDGPNYDHDAVFLDLLTLLEYAYHAPRVVPTTSVEPVVVVPPVVTPDPTPTTPSEPVVSPPVVTPNPSPIVPPKPPVVTPSTGGVGFWKSILNWLKALLGIRS